MQDKIVKEFLDKISPYKKYFKGIYLFGSRARGDEKPYSDYDFLLVMPKRDEKVVDNVYDVVVDTLLDTGKVISLKIFKEEDFKRLSSIPTPFMSRVLKEGIKYG
jgi:predicted nucleotidyltransferase